MVKILDNGYVELVSTWGSDEGIIEAARMSTGKGFQGWSFDDGRERDIKLLRYLWEHKHHTPFEMAGMTIEVQAPIFVFREWHRHRTQCLAGDTIIPYFSPRGTSTSRTIEQLFQLKHGGVWDMNPVKNGLNRHGQQAYTKQRGFREGRDRCRILPNCQTRVLRVIDEATGTVLFGETADIYESGIKEILRLELGNGSVLRASAAHPILTIDGWVNLGDLCSKTLVATARVTAIRERSIPPSLRTGIGVWTTMMRKRLIKPYDTCYICSQEFGFDDLELDHIIPVADNLELALVKKNLAPVCIQCHREKTNTEQPTRKGQTGTARVWSPVLFKPERVAEEATYDIEMAGPHHNFVANGIFVHNSFNELSARYTELPDLYYYPSVERIMGGVQSQKSKQGSEEGFTQMDAQMMRMDIIDATTRMRKVYEELLKEGMARELARVIIPVNQYSRMRASANLRNWLGFLTLRTANNAQWEIRQYAWAVADLIATTFPKTYALWESGLSGVTRS